MFVDCCLKNTLSLSKQLEFYMEYQKKLELIAGKTNATSIITEAVYLISAGSSDFLQNYYINPLLYKLYSLEEFSNVLVQQFAEFVRVRYYFSLHFVFFFLFFNLVFTPL